MQAILKEFKPLIKNNLHDKYEDNYKFSVTLEDNGSVILGEAWSKHPTGSKSWTIGLMHDYQSKDNQYCDNGKKITALKVAENATQSSTSTPSFSKPTASYDFSKEAFVISRFSHTIALDHIKTLDTESLTKLKKDKGDQLVSLYAKSYANSVYEVYCQVIKLHEERNKQTP